MDENLSPDLKSKIALMKRELEIIENTLNKIPMRFAENGSWIKVATTMIYCDYDEKEVPYSSYSLAPFNEVHYRRTSESNFPNEKVVLK